MKQVETCPERKKRMKGKKKEMGKKRRRELNKYRHG